MRTNDEQERRAFLSWRGLLIASAIVPLVASLAFGALAGGNIVLGFLINFFVSSLISYATAFCIAMPCLWCLSWFTRLTRIKTVVVGAVVGGALWLPVTALEWQTSGADSGPPPDPLPAMLRDEAGDWATWLLMAAGAVTAAAYWRIAARDARRWRRRHTIGGPDCCRWRSGESSRRVYRSVWG